VFIRASRRIVVQIGLCAWHAPVRKAEDGTTAIRSVLQAKGKPQSDLRRVSCESIQR
jgi:hypothetical protein